MARTVTEAAPQARNDSYTALLTISLMAMIGACLLLYFDIQSYPTLNPAQKDSAAISPPKASEAAQKAADAAKAAAPEKSATEPPPAPAKGVPPPTKGTPPAPEE